jgi:hypothetical protein
MTEEQIQREQRLQKLRAKALAELEKYGARGITADYIDHEDPHTSGRIMGKLKKEGLAFCCQPAKRKSTNAMRWFSTEAFAKEFKRKEAADMVNFVAIHRGKPGGSIGFEADARVIWPEHVKVIQCPGPQLRYASNTFDGEILE